MSPDQHQPSTPGKKPKANLLRLLLPVIVVIISASVAFWMMQSGPKAKPRAKTRNAVLVDVRPIEMGPQTTTVSVMGTVRPQREVALKPRVSGEIIKIGDNPIDYQLVVRQLASEVARVETDMQVELGRQRVAQKEYELLGESVSEVEKTLMLREPQLQSNRALLEGTRARLEQAQLDLKRTSVRSPFNAVVMSREVNLGTRVSPSTTLATLVGSDSYWVEAPVPASQLQWISISQEDNDSGSSVRIYDSAAWGPNRSRSGQLVGLTAMVEENGRMAKLLAEIPDPLSLQETSSEQPKLLLGSYVRVEIEGKLLAKAAAIDRDLIHNGEQLWIMDEEGRLDIRTVEIAFRGQDQVLVTDGVSHGEKLITTNLPSPVQGMTLRLQEAETPSPAAEEKNKP
jgi:RND family efflux transporter MFP subunit